MADPPAPSPPIHLHCLGGNEAPPDLRADLLRLENLPQAAKEHLWEILGPSLADPLPAGLDERVARFCAAHGTSTAELGLVVKAARFLFREAASRDLGRLPFLEDLAHASDRNVDVSRILMAGFDAAKAELRREMAAATLADHGKRLDGIDYRAEIITSSSRAKRLDIPVALLTFSYREGHGDNRITLHLSPDKVRELREVCDTILRRG